MSVDDDDNDDSLDDIVMSSLTSLGVLAAADEYDEAACRNFVVHCSGAALDDVTV